MTTAKRHAPGIFCRVLHGGPWLAALLLFAAGLTARADSPVRHSFSDSLKRVPGAAGAAPGSPRVVRTTLTAAELAENLDFVVSLRMRNLAELEGRLARGGGVAPADMEARYLPLPADYAAVADWLTAAGLTVTGQSPSHTNLFVRGTVTQIQAALGTTFGRVGTAEGEFTSALTAPTLPASIAGAVLGIHGLQRHLRLRHPRPITQPLILQLNGSPHVGPSDLFTRYNAPGILSGSGQTIAILIDAEVNTADLTQFWAADGVPQSLANVTQIKVNGGPTAASPNPDALESTLDVEWSSSVAPGAKIRLYAIPDLSYTSIFDGVDRVLADAASKHITVLSMSFGGQEDQNSSSFLASSSQTFAELAAAGVTTLASSGDSGSNPTLQDFNAYDPTAPLTPEYPASDPNVGGVGGTTLTYAASGSGSATTYAFSSETAWDELSVGDTGGFATGGGISGFFTKPSWQTDGGSLLAGGTGTMRCIPDVAAISSASSSTGGASSLDVSIVIDGTTESLEGTSLACPVWAGIVARINQARANAGLATVGLLGPAVYPLHGAAAFNDITSGSNGAYSAGAGYDLCTGLGSPNITGITAGLVGLSVASQPQSQSVAAGSSVTLSLGATGLSSATYQWQFQGTALADGAGISGSTTPSLSFAAIQPGNGGAYTLVVANVSGAPILSYSATLTVVGPPAGQVTAPAPAAAVPGGSAVTLAAAGSSGDGPLAFQWEWNGSALSGATSSAYSLPSANAGNSGTYAVLLSNQDGSTLLPAGTLTVTGPAGTIVTAAPGGLPPGGTFTLRVSGTSSGGALTYQWQFDGSAIAGATSSSYTITGAEPENTGTYSVVLTDSNGAPVFAAGTLTLSGPAYETPYAISTYAGLYRGSGSANGTGSAARFSNAGQVAVDSAGNVYVADTGNDTIRKIAPGGIVTTFAGFAAASGSANGTGTAARFNSPQAVAVDSAGNLYVTDSFNYEIRKVTPTGVVTTLAGSAGSFGSLDGTGTAALFGEPSGIAVDKSGNVYVADESFDTIRKITPAGVVTTLAGTPDAKGSADGTGSSAQFNDPQGLAVDASGSLYVADFENDTIRKVSSAGVVTTLAGVAGSFGRADGTGSLARFLEPEGVAVDASGTIYVADTFNLTVRKITAGGVVSTLAGVPGSQGSADGTGSAARFYGPTGIAVTQAGQLYLSEGFGDTIRVGGLPAAPTITTQPAAVTVLAGGAPTLVVAATGAPTPTYQWTLNGNPISGATSSTLTLSGITAAQQGTYAVVVTNTSGSVTSSGAFVTVDFAPVLTQQPNSRTLPTGASTSWQAWANGNPGVTYVWTLGGVPIGGATSWIYTVTSASSTDAGTYQVIASNAVGSASSATWTLAVGAAPTIATQPSTQYVLPGGTAHLSVVAASGGGTLPVTGYQWTLDGVPLSNGGTLSGATSSTLTLTNVTSGSNPYQVTVLNAVGGTMSAGVSVVVGTPPVLTQQPNSRTLPTGASTSWQAWANGNPGVTYAWTLGGVPISGATSWIYTVTSASSTDAGTYQVIASNAVGSASSATWTLAVGAAPAITTQPSTQYVLPGGAAHLSVVAGSGAGILPVTGYQWTLDGAPLSNGGNISGATSSTLTISNVTSGSNPYQVNVLSAAGGVTSGGASVVVGTAPVLTQQPNSRTLPTGASTSWQAWANGNPGVTYAWTLGGVPISGATSWIYTVTSASSTDAGTYQVIASNAVGSASSATWTLDVGSAPAITTQPSTQYVLPGGAAHLSVVAGSGAGILPVTGYQWTLDGAPLSNGGNISGATSSTLTISNVTSGSNPYQVNVLSAAGGVTSGGASVVVGTAPVLTQQPNSRTLPTGASTSWQAWANGNPGVTYAWTLGGVPISGATSWIYTVTSASSTDAGTYQVIASNAVGSASSATWTLDVGSAPAITTQPAAVTADSGATVTLSVGLGAVDAWPGTATYQWTVNGTAIGGATSATYSLPYASQANSASYAVQVADAVGSVTSDSAYVHVLAPVLSWSLGQVGTDAPGSIRTTFTIPPGPSRTVVVAGLGPILGMPGTVSNPRIDVYDSNSNDVLTATGMPTFNANPGYQATTLSAAHLHCAISLTAASPDSEGLLTLAPGSYTAVLSAANTASGATTGLGELAVYDLSNQAFSDTETTTQAPILGPDGPLTEKFLVAGSGSDTVIVAALGPGLAAAPKAISSPLPDPTLAVNDQNGSLIGTNAGTASSNAELTTDESSGYGYTVVSGDSGLAPTLAPGVYTAVATSASGSDSGTTEIDVLQQ